MKISSRIFYREINLQSINKASIVRLMLFVYQKIAVKMGKNRHALLKTASHSKTACQGFKSFCFCKLLAQIKSQLGIIIKQAPFHVIISTCKFSVALANSKKYLFYFFISFFLFLNFLSIIRCNYSYPMTFLL